MAIGYRMVKTRSRDPIVRTLRAFALGFTFGILAFPLLTSVLGPNWANWGDDTALIRVTRVPAYGGYKCGLGMSAANSRSVFSTIGNTNSCPPGLLRILVLVLSDPNGLDRRNTVRTTWLKGTPTRHSDYILKWKFVIGTENITSNSTEMLRVEQSFFNDLLLFPHLKDDYRNLTRKMWLSMRWAGELAGEFKFDFLVKADDDSFVLLDKLVSTLRKLNCDSRLYWGYFVGCSLPQSIGKWFEPNWNTCPHYLPYAMGGGYVMSYKVVQMIAKHAGRLRRYNNEDVTTGSWLAPYKLVRKHDLRFDVESHKHGCNNNYIIAHKQLTRSDMEEKSANLRVNGTLCTVEKEIRPAYIYNWTTLPMDCCQRAKGLPVLDIDP